MTALELRPDVSTTPTGDGMVLLDERSGRYFHLNGSGAEITRMLLGGSDAEETARRLAERYALSQERAAADVDGLIAALEGAGLVAR
ncbi:lasso peptide biosynthesis PqqD family chaperone [Nocardiopsis sp. RSe5-2]|uniref:Lasso peptide biosynthesis PqqD family chaperone n=1 Tax=Nocardiopsis endophytica TaxID=3018445 RepID=A0ABT4TWK0_9ACTN|nr:lasso peptide biosynthesis PqqD family chaperone [Nocardiopsis endophytica]MDA2809072.1 lasso peptide biosynthesis PqqD family chaperone [Nocardiopsis endophytica]